MGNGSNKVVTIIQARMGSTRLPGKSMMDLAGAPLVGRILERVRRVKKIDQIVLATSDKEQDNVLEKLADDYLVPCFRGSENDLVDRYYQAAVAYDADVIVRFPGDNPTPEPSEIDRIIKYHLKGDNDFSTNLVPAFDNGYPMGIGAEVFSKETLKSVWLRNDELVQREHLSFNFFDFYENKIIEPERYRVGTISCPEEFSGSDLVLHVDTEQDYRYMYDLYSYLYPRNNKFSITDIIDWDKRLKNNLINHE